MTLPFALPPQIPLDGYGPASLLTEAELFRRTRVEPCACGDAIELRPGHDVATVLGRHVRDVQHAAWRREREATL